MKQTHYLIVNANLQKLKVYQDSLVGHDQKWVWPIWYVDSRIDCISRIN